MGRKKTAIHESLDSSAIRVEISIPEARKVVAEFSKDRIAAFRALSVSVRSAVTLAINQQFPLTHNTA